MQLRFQVALPSIVATKEVAGTDLPMPAGTAVQIEGMGDLTAQPGYESRGGEIGEAALTFTLAVAAGVTAKMIGEWMSDRLRRAGGRVLRIGRETVEIEEGEITRVVKEILELEE